MEIGIITLHASDNCGSLLQAYALQYVLENNFNHRVKVIDFSSSNGRKMYRIIHPSYLKSPLKFFCTLIEYSQLKNQKMDYDLFRKKYLNLTEQNYDSAESLKKADVGFDVIITGSDQVWNTRMYDFDKAFFLAWVTHAKKAAYAVSLGDHKNDYNFVEEINVYIDGLNSFDLISVREEPSQLKLASILKKEIQLCVDPTLLVPPPHWNELAGDRMVNTKYIFYYSYNYGNDIKNQLVTQVSEYYGLPVIVINQSKWLGKQYKKYGFELFNKTGPLVFLNLMKYATYTLVESFHGIIFSFLMQKQFWFLKKDIQEVLDERIDGILTLLVCKNRTLAPQTENGFFMVEDEIDYNRKLNNLEKLQNESFDYLNSI